MHKPLLLACCALLTACTDGFFTAPAPAERGALAVSYSVAASDGEVFDRANRVNVFVGLSRTDAPSDPAVVAFDTTIAMSPSAETRVRLPIDASEGTYQGIAGVAVMRDNDTLFTRFDEVSIRITKGEANQIVFGALRPFVTQVTMPSNLRTLSGAGDTLTIVATPRFATGDVVTGATCMYFTPDANQTVVTLNTSTGRVVARNAGTTTISYVCQFARGIGSVNVTVAGAPPTGTASLTGTVVSATTNTPIAGATLTLTPQGGSPRSATTGSGGTYAVQNLGTGAHIVTVRATGFSDFTTTINIVAGAQDRVFALSPAAAAGSWRMVLTWGATPEDLDSHLFITGDSSRTAQVFFGDPGSSTAYPFATLDFDVTEGHGPETMTITRVMAGALYKYSVNLFSGSSGTLSTSQARVDVYNGSTLVATFTPPSGGTGEWWNVFTMQNNSVTSVNTITNSPPSFNSGSRPAMNELRKPKGR